MRYKAVGFEAAGRRQEAEVSVLDSFENSYILYFINLKYAVSYYKNLEKNLAIASYTKALEFRNGKSFLRVTEEGLIKPVLRDFSGMREKTGVVVNKLETKAQHSNSQSSC